MAEVKVLKSEGGQLGQLRPTADSVRVLSIGVGASAPSAGLAPTAAGQVGMDANGRPLIYVGGQAQPVAHTGDGGAYTVTTAQFTQPAAAANVQVSVTNALWMVAGEVIYVATGGYYQIVSVDSGTLATVKNLGYTGNLAAGQTVSSGAGVTPGGVQGAAASAASLYAVDSYTLHRWKMDESSGNFADTGSAANAALTQFSGTPIYGELGPVSTCAYLGPASVEARSSADVGLPSSTTQVSVYGWVKAVSFPTTWMRLGGKLYNPAINVGADSCMLLMQSAGGVYADPYLSWASSTTNKNTTPTSIAARGRIYPRLWYHVGATFSQTSSTATVCIYVNGRKVLQQDVTSAAINWNSGSSGAWLVGGNVTNNASYCDGWFFDWRFDDGIVRAESFFTAVYKATAGLLY
jgi:hypothetical protein